jgi:ferric-dicitrate binding protein FerR (iron transport regulator)
MAPPLSALKADAALPRPRDGWRLALLWGGGGLVALLLAGALALWFHYGTAVFFETIATGFANCF